MIGHGFFPSIVVLAGFLPLAAIVLVSASSEVVVGNAVFQERNLASGDFAEINVVLKDAEFQLPDMSSSEDSTTLSLSNIVCTGVQVADVSMSSSGRTSGSTLAPVSLDLSMQVVDLDMICNARYYYDGWLISGRGNVQVTSRGSDVSLDGNIAAAEQNAPPTLVTIDTCSPSVNINNIDFDDGGIVGWILNLIEGLARGMMETLVEELLCTELQEALLSAQDILSSLKEELDNYKAGGSVGALDAEYALVPPPGTNLLDFQNPQSIFGKWVHETLKATVDYLSEIMVDSTSTTGSDLRVNSLIRQFILGGDVALLIDTSSWLPVDSNGNSILFYNHDVLLETTVKLNSVHLIGLDTLYEFDPMDIVGQYTLQSRLAWKRLTVQISATVEIRPSTLEDSIVETPADAVIVEDITVVSGLGDLTTSVALLSAIDQDLLEKIKLGSILKMDDLLPCMLSTIVEAALSSLAVEAGGIYYPYLSGFTSVGLDRVFDEILMAAFLLYEDVVLQRAPVYFQTDVRTLVNDHLLQEFLTMSGTCTNVEATSDSSFVDFRDLLLTPTNALDRGGSGEAPYGDVVYSFLVPTLQEQILEVDKFNERIIHTVTASQSGIRGALTFDRTLLNYQSSEPSSLFDAAVMHVSNIRITNLDTVSESPTLLDPKESNRFSNTLAIGDAAHPLTITASVLVAVGDTTSPLYMTNQIDFSISVPWATVSMDVLANMQENSLLNFPLTDMTNPYCWLAAFGGDSIKDGSPIDLSSFSLGLSTFHLDASCLSCTSPGTDYLSSVLGNLESLGFQEFFTTPIIEMVEEIAWGAWQSYDIDEILFNASMLCPHHENYDAAVKLVEFPWPVIPALSRASMETLLSVTVVGWQTFLVMAAKNYIASEVLSALEEPTSGTAYPQGSSILDWGNLSSEMGEWADFAFEQLRLFLMEPATEISENRRLDRETSRLVTLLEEYVLDKDGAYTFEVGTIDSPISGFEIKSCHIHLLGISRLSALEVLIPADQQILENRFEMDELTLVLGTNITVDGQDENIQFTYTIRNITAQLDLLVAVDLEILREIQIGSVFNMSKIFPCLAAGLQEFQINGLSTTVGEISQPQISGFFSEDHGDSMNVVLTSIVETYGSDILEATPLFLSTTFREIINAILPTLLDSMETDCQPPDTFPSSGKVDFRDLLLSPTEAKSLGGSGCLPYGDLFWYLYDLLEENVLRVGASNRPVVNDIFRYVTQEQSGIEGTFLFEGNLVDSQSTFKIAGLEADIGFRLSNVTLENVDSVGDPLDIVRPIEKEPNLLGNIVSLGVDLKPLSLAVTILLSVSDGVELNIRNELKLSLLLENVVVVAELLLRLSEQAFATFPIRDLNNLHCWVATILSEDSENGPAFRGIGLEDHALSIGDFGLDLSCISCTSPDFDVFLLSLYDFENTTDLESTIREQSQRLFDSDFFPVLIDQIVLDSATKCPHHPDYDPNSKPVTFLSSPADSLGILEIVSSSKKPSYFNIVNAAIVAFLFIFGFTARWFVKRRNEKWIGTLSREGSQLLRQQQDKDRQMQAMLDSTTVSLFSSPTIPLHIRYGVPAAVILNFVLYLVGHFGTLSIVNVDATIAGEEFTIYKFLEFRFIASTRETFKNGGAEMAVLLWLFTGIWPYIKLFLSLFLWMVPPDRLSVKRRGQAILWIDALAKLSIIDIFTMLLAFAVFLVFVGGPDEDLNSTDIVLYAFKAIVIPKAGFYCLIVAQRMSRVSSRFFLEYHDAIVRAATEEYVLQLDPRCRCLSDYPDMRSTCDKSTDSVDGSPLPTTTQLENDENDDDAAVRSLMHRVEEVSKRVYADDDEASPSNSCCSDFESEPVPSINEDSRDDKVSNGKNECTPETPKEFHWGTLGVSFGGITILIIFIIGCIFAPAVSIDTSSIAGLAVESGMTFEDVTSEYGVFIVVSSILVKARFVLNTKTDYIGFGFLLVGALVSIACIFFMQAYQFVKRKIQERQLGPVVPLYGHEGCGLPTYFQLYKWKHMEIYLISVAIGVWQLGSACAYAIHLYCDILRQSYAVLAYLGLIEESTSQCSRVQASLPGNLIIMGGAFVILMMVFFFQAATQYRKNIAECLRWVDEKDVPRLSLAWSKDKSKNSRYSHFTSVTSIDRQNTERELDVPTTPNTAAMTPPGSPGGDDDSVSVHTPVDSCMLQPSVLFETPPRSAVVSSNRLSAHCMPPRKSESMTRIRSQPDDDASCLPPPPPQVHSREAPSVSGNDSVYQGFSRSGDNSLC